MADISLLFGVEGGGSISSGSGKLIASQLSSIVNQINSNPLEIKFKADAESLSALSKQLSDISKSVKEAGVIDLGVTGMGETAKSIDKLGASLDSISTDLKAVREVIASIGASLPQSGSAMEKMLRSGSVGVEDLVSKLTELRDIINQINSKDFNITNTFSYTKQAQTGADELELYREKAYETLDVVRKLDSELVRAQKLGGSITSSAIAKTGDANGFLQSVNDYLSMTSSGRKANITKAKSVGELQSIIKQNEEFARSYTKVLTAVNEDGFSISFPDMSGVDSANRAIDAYKSKAQELENTFVEATKSASELNNTQKNLYEGMSVDGAEGGISEAIRKEFGEIDVELTSLRERIESVFDFTTLTIDTSKIKSALDEVKQEFDSLKNTSADNKVSRTTSSGRSTSTQTSSTSMDDNRALEKRLSLLKQVYDIQKKIARYSSRDTNSTNGDIKNISESRLPQIREGAGSLASSLEGLDTSNVHDLATALDAAELELKQIKVAIADYDKAIASAGASSSKIVAGSEKQRRSIEKLRNLYNEVSKSIKNFSSARTGISRGSYEDLAATLPDIDKLITRLESGEITVEDFEKEYNSLTKTVRNSTDVIKKNGEAHKATGESLRGLAKKFSTWFGITQIISAVYRSMRMMVNEVVELDSAMTELKKVTDETEASYELFLNNAAKRSRELGASLSDTVNATADFARLGYSIEDAEAMADAAIVYKTVGDGIEDINEASESIIATMQAFGSETLSAMGIVDKFNNVGRIFADLCSNAQKVKVAISVKSQRWSRPSKDSVILRMRRDCNTFIGNNRGFATPLFKG